MRKKSLLPIGLVALLVATISFALWPHTGNHTQAPTQSITIGNHKFSATLAQTPQQKIDGLGGWTHLGPYQGMYFPLDDYPASFWMKGMLIDIDIIWIDEGRIVDINHQVPAPEANTPDHQLPRYPAPVDEPDAVFEIAAGRAQELGLEVGDKIKLGF